MSRVELGHKPYPRVLCRGWLSSTGVQMSCAGTGYVQAGEPGGEIVLGQCVMCGELERQAWVLRRARQERELQRKALKGYGPPLDGEDIWRGFREGE